VVIRPLEKTIKFFFEVAKSVPKSLEKALKNWLKYELDVTRKYLTQEELATFEDIDSWSYEAMPDTEWQLEQKKKNIDKGRSPVGAATCLLAMELMQSIVPPKGIDRIAVREMTSRQFRQDLIIAEANDGLGWFRGE